MTDSRTETTLEFADAPRQVGIQTERHRGSGAEDRKPGKTARNLPLSNGDDMISPDIPSKNQESASSDRSLVLKSRADLRALLIEAGLARAAADKVARGGWPALAGEITETDIVEESAELARALAKTLMEK